MFKLSTYYHLKKKEAKLKQRVLTEEKLNEISAGFKYFFKNPSVNLAQETGLSIFQFQVSRK
jgi:hypothetical protein